MFTSSPASPGWNTGAAARGKPLTLTPSFLKRAAPREHIYGRKKMQYVFKFDGNSWFSAASLHERALAWSPSSGSWRAAGLPVQMKRLNTNGAWSEILSAGKEGGPLPVRLAPNRNAGHHFYLRQKCRPRALLRGGQQHHGELKRICVHILCFCSSQSNLFFSFFLPSAQHPRYIWRRQGICAENQFVGGKYSSHIIYI